MGGERGREREEFLFRENFDAIVVVRMTEGRGGKIVWASTIEGDGGGGREGRRKTEMKDEDGDLSPARVRSNTS